MRALIEIKPVKEQWTFVPALFCSCIVDRSASFMSGRNWKNWVLYINGRLYPWPIFEYQESISYMKLEKHIKECIELDKAFYA